MTYGMNISAGTERMTAIVLRGSLLVLIALTVLLTLHGIASGNLRIQRIEFGLIIILYLFFAEYLAKKQKHVVAGWMIMTLYVLLGLSTLLTWGLNSPVGILVIGFVVFLSGVMLGTKYIVWVMSGVALLLFLVQYIHKTGHVSPNYQVFARPSDFFDVFAYITILGIFALLSWLSGKQTERSLIRAKTAEENLRIEKDNLVIKLEEQSKRLQQAQLQEMMQLYKFAEIGQSTTITLHELSNLLSELTLDIDDIGQQQDRSKAIINVKDGISRINRLVRQTRKQIHDNSTTEVFSLIPVINTVVEEYESKFKLKNITFLTHIPKSTAFKIVGDALNFSHVLIILLNNALDACELKHEKKVSIEVIQKKDIIAITISDNGPGIPINSRSHLFSPHTSNKPTGLGIGLYVTKHIIESQLHGRIYLEPTSIGASFKIELPKYKL
ncbi:MAG: ATPase [Candidatus Saccharibacteria bacterium]|nr:ATPase [Candidatus Saccharibacteria bacterium]